MGNKRNKKKKIDKRKLPKQASNFGLKVVDFTKHGAYTFLRFGTHLCKNCILRELDKCPCYGQEIEIDGKTVKVGLDTECPIIKNYVDGIIDELMALPHIKPQDFITVQQLARALGFIAIGNKYLNEIGVFRVNKDKTIIDVQPLVNAMAKYEGLVNRLSESLGLTPRSRVQLKLDKRTTPLSTAIVQMESGENNNED